MTTLLPQAIDGRTSEPPYVFMETQSQVPEDLKVQEYNTNKKTQDNNVNRYLMRKDHSAA